MKRAVLFIFALSILLSSCSNISNKPVSEKLSTDELAKAIKSDTLFSTFYEIVRKKTDDMDDIKKAKFNDVTYRRLFKYIKYLQDTTGRRPQAEKWDKEWEKDFGAYSTKADSTLNYWQKYLAENSLSKYVKVELAQIDKEYYSYIGGIKDVNLGFRLTPLLGTIEQIRFNYGYKAKINGDKYFERHKCISTAPFSAPAIRYWSVAYSDKDNFSGQTLETFLRDYNLDIEITNIRKDGVNISTEDFNVPKEVSDYLSYGKGDTLMNDFYKDKVIKALVDKDYMSKWEFKKKKLDEIQEKEDKLCFDFLKELYK